VLQTGLAQLQVGAVHHLDALDRKAAVEGQLDQLLRKQLAHDHPCDLGQIEALLAELGEEPQEVQSVSRTLIDVQHCLGLRHLSLQDEGFEVGDVGDDVGVGVAGEHGVEALQRVVLVEFQLYLHFGVGVEGVGREGEWQEV